MTADVLAFLPLSAQNAANIAPPSDWRRVLLYDSKGNLKPILGNVIAILAHDPQWAGRIALNEFTHRVSIGHPPPWDPEFAPLRAQKTGDTWSDEDNHRTVAWLQHRFAIKVTSSLVADAVKVAAQRHAFNPVQEYLGDLKWDEKQRLSKWLHTYCGAVDNAYTSYVGRWWLISGVARSYEPGCQVDHALVLMGKQGGFKSSVLRALVRDGEFTDNMTNPDRKKEDFAMQLRGKRIVEFQEFEQFTKGVSSSKIKEVISTREDDGRDPYGKLPKMIARQNIFAGTTNKDTFLEDETGGRRFWPVKCGARLDVEGVKRDRDQLWAEAVQAYRAGEKWYPEDPAVKLLIEREQDDCRTPRVWENLIREYVVRNSITEITVDEVLSHVLVKDKATWGKADQMEVAKCLVPLGFEKGRVKRNGGEVKGWVKPKPKPTT